MSDEPAEPLLSLHDKHIGIDSDLYHFRAANAYKHRTLDMTSWDYGQQWAFVSDAVQSGDLMVLLERGRVPFVLREIHGDKGANEFLFLGPAIIERPLPNYNKVFEDTITEEFVLV
jgi:hypothetical protein